MDGLELEILNLIGSFSLQNCTHLEHKGLSLPKVMTSFTWQISIGMSCKHELNRIDDQTQICIDL